MFQPIRQVMLPFQPKKYPRCWSCFQVLAEAKKKAAEAKSRSDDAFRRKEYPVDAYTQAIDFDPSDATLLSNRSLCWMRLGQADRALTDAQACTELTPNWQKAWEAFEAGRQFHGVNKEK